MIKKKQEKVGVNRRITEKNANIIEIIFFCWSIGDI